jgi:hypothetical protein
MQRLTARTLPLARLAVIALLALIAFHPVSSQISRQQRVREDLLVPDIALESPQQKAVYKLANGSVTIPVRVRARPNDRWQVHNIAARSSRAGSSASPEQPCKKERENVYSCTLSMSEVGHYTVTATTTYELKGSQPTVTQNSSASAVIRVEAAAQSGARAVQGMGASSSGSHLNPNGIHVGQTKLFDERSLALKLQVLEAALANQVFYNREALEAAIGKTQGMRQRASALSVQVNSLPLPAVTTTTGQTPLTTKTPGGGETQTLANTTGTKVERPEVGPQIPDLPPQSSATDYQPSFGYGPSDILAEQVALTYEITNLGMLLERAISDRVKLHDDRVYERVPALIGLQVNIDAQHAYKNAVAEVDVSLTSDDPVTEPPSLVALLPKEKTYNAATVTKDYKNFGGGAVVQVISFGVNVSQTKETFYLVRDTDTVALERPGVWEQTEQAREKLARCRPAGQAAAPTNEQALTFGWQFRPVLGRESVQPGTRQVYALLSLPVEYKKCDLYGAKVEVRTRWRKFDAKRNTVGEVIACSSRTQSLDSLLVTRAFTEALQPKVDNAQWEDRGQGLALVKVQGSNFFSDTAVLAGTTALDAASGLAIRDEHDLSFIIPIRDLAQGSDLQVFGRFGVPAPVLVRYTSTPTDPALGISIPQPVSVTALDAQHSRITVILKSKNNSAPVIAQSLNPLVIVGGRIFGAGDSPLEVSHRSNDIVLSFVAPTQFLREARKLTVRYPLWGSDFVAECELNVADSFSASKVTYLSAMSNRVQLAISGSNFKMDSVAVHLGNRVYTCYDLALQFIGPEMLHLDLPLTPDLATVKQLIVKQGGQHFLLPLTSPAQPSPKPKVIKAGQVKVGDSKVVTIEGANFDSIQEVRFEGRVFVFETEDDGATLKLAVTLDLTAVAGTKQLSFVLKDGKTTTYDLEVVSR